MRSPVENCNFQRISKKFESLILEDFGENSKQLESKLFTSAIELENNLNHFSFQAAATKFTKGYKNVNAEIVNLHKRIRKLKENGTR